MNARIVLLPGDGVGPEVLRESRNLLERIGELTGNSFSLQEALIGGAAIRATGTPLPPATVEACEGIQNESGSWARKVGSAAWGRPALD